MINGMKSLVFGLGLLSLYSCGSGSSSSAITEPNRVTVDEAANRTNNASKQVIVIHQKSEDATTLIESATTNAKDAKGLADFIYEKGTKPKSEPASKLVTEVGLVIGELERAKDKTKAVTEVSEAVRDDLAVVEDELLTAQKNIGAWEQSFKDQKIALDSALESIESLRKEVIKLEKGKAKSEVWASFSKWALGIVITCIVLYVVYLKFFPHFSLFRLFKGTP